MYLYAPDYILHTAGSRKSISDGKGKHLRTYWMHAGGAPGYTVSPSAAHFESFESSRHLKKMTEEYPTLPQGAEASLPLTGSASCGVSGILRKMWTRHKKKSEYVGATNSAFEAD
ncbi:hypothetical protein P7K49_027118 [Saguinus oedipus]|uniref:Vexin n=1 Tax=Saguinus oedipus TaxID=9490 RepID=A0ABQ9UF53_SAGOE|nr:hypothetical protein P7K49_027118 [Saguinus oedipus]